MAENNKQKAYQGPDKYIFVSFSHKDDALVWPFIAKLQEKYNVWFDDGLQAGEEWVKQIVSKLKKCSVFLFIVSQNSLNSKFCQNEIAFANDKNIPFVNIITENAFEIPNWFKFRYGRFPILSLSKYKDLTAAVNDLDKKTWFDFKTVLKTNV